MNGRVSSATWTWWMRVGEAKSRLGSLSVGLSRDEVTLVDSGITSKIIRIFYKG